MGVLTLYDRMDYTATSTTRLPQTPIRSLRTRMMIEYKNPSACTITGSPVDSVSDLGVVC